MSFSFVSDRPVLDFLPTLAARGTVEEEKLSTPQDLADWVVAAGLLDGSPSVTAGDLTRTRAVREALFRFVASMIDGTPISTTDRDLVNAVAAVPPPSLELTVDGLRRHGDVDAVLSLLARDALELLVSPDRASLHWCADHTCTRPFVDRSRAQGRRWCGMKGCGDRAKAAAYRERRRAGSHDVTPS